MKKLIQLIALGAVVTMLALPAFAQEPTASPSASPTTTAAQGGQDDAEAKAALYKRVTDNYKTNQPVAYEAAKEYLQKYPNDDPKIIQYLQNFVTKYDKAKTQSDFPKLVSDKKYDEAFTLGKQILASDPENLSVTMNLGYAGYLAALAKNTAHNAEAMSYAKRAIQMIESGKSPDNWGPFRTKDEALGYLNFALGFLNLETNQNDAINYLAKALQYETPLKKEPITYFYLGYAYDSGPYKKQSDEFTAKYQGKPETPESKAALESLNQVIDRLIDAYARAVAYATDAKYQADKAKWMARLTELYTFRHNNSDAGLQELIANVRNTPLPPPPTAAPSATAPTAPTTPTTPAGTTTSGTDGGAATGTTGNTGTGTTTTTTTPADTTKPNNSSTTPTTTTPGKGGTTTPTTTPPAKKP